jgi:hypothetical protein
VFSNGGEPVLPSNARGEPVESRILNPRAVITPSASTWTAEAAASSASNLWTADTCMPKFKSPNPSKPTHRPRQPPKTGNLRLQLADLVDKQGAGAVIVAHDWPFKTQVPTARAPSRERPSS